MSNGWSGRLHGNEKVFWILGKINGQIGLSWKIVNSYVSVREKCALIFRQQGHQWTKSMIESICISLMIIQG